MTKEEILAEIKQLHDDLKIHPYWMNFEHSLYKKEVYPMLNKIMELISKLKYNVTDFNSDTPFFALYNMLVHDFNTMKSLMYWTDNVEQTDNFKNYYIVVLQNFIQLIHYFIEGIEDENILVMYMPNNVYNPKALIKHIPMYHEEWKNDEGYVFYSPSRGKWHSVTEIKEKDKDKLINSLTNIIERTKRDSLNEFYKHSLKDVNDNTNFIYKIT